GHDLGHTPFGHLGERIVEKILHEEDPARPPFHHELFSLRVVDRLTNYGRGLNLSYAVRDGIATHCGERFEQRIKPDFTVKLLAELTGMDDYPATWEGCVVRMADKIAYLGRDLEDALQLKIIKREQIPVEPARVLGVANSDIINALVGDLIAESLRTGEIGFSDDIFQAILAMKQFNYRTIYEGPALTGYHTYFERILRTLWAYLRDLYTRYGDDIPRYGARTTGSQPIRRLHRQDERLYEGVDKGWGNLVLDYVAGMTDDYALECVQEIMIPRKFEYRFDEEALR
ncbi:MAG: phosphohydrolase, partial [Candidatus Competibacteraceae bacterium]|nr:phosphohydrolase [Candidatus Competibacteraceae bacterium]